MAHIGDVIANGLGWERDIWSVPGGDLAKFGDRVREWAHAVSPTDGSAPSDAAYYGGWPSANLSTIGWGGAVSTALLLEDRIVGKDPISDWFCLERYSRPNFMASRTGWQSQGLGTPPDVAATRRFLAVQLPAIRALLPLLDSGLVTLVPSEITREASRDEIEQLAGRIAEVVLTDPPQLARQFRPEDLAVDDDIRGFFALAGGEVEGQTRKHLQRAVDYFAAEYVLSQKADATYTSVFEWESYLLRQGVSTALSPMLPTAQVMLSTRIPALAGLTPEIIRTIHDDETFGDFRADLENIYGNCPRAPQAEVDAYVRDREKVLLEPKLHRLTKEMDRGRLARIGIGPVGGCSFSLAASLLTIVAGGIAKDPLTTASGVVASTAAAGGFAWARRQPKDTKKIWSALIKHGGSIRDEVPRATDQAESSAPGPSGNPWGIDTEPGQFVRVTPGMILHWNQERPGGSVIGDQFHEGVYAPCPCGSKHKYKFCCAGVAPAPQPPRPGG